MQQFGSFKVYLHIPEPEKYYGDLSLFRSDYELYINMVIKEYREKNPGVQLPGDGSDDRYYKCCTTPSSPGLYLGVVRDGITVSDGSDYLYVDDDNFNLNVSPYLRNAFYLGNDRVIKDAERASIRSLGYYISMSPEVDASAEVDVRREAESEVAASDYFHAIPVNHPNDKHPADSSEHFTINLQSDTAEIRIYDAVDSYDEFRKTDVQAHICRLVHKSKINESSGNYLYLPVKEGIKIQKEEKTDFGGVRKDYYFINMLSGDLKISDVFDLANAFFVKEKKYFEEISDSNCIKASIAPVGYGFIIDLNNPNLEEASDDEASQADPSPSKSDPFKPLFARKMNWPTGEEYSPGIFYFSPYLILMMDYLVEEKRWWMRALTAVVLLPLAVIAMPLILALEAIASLGHDLYQLYKRYPISMSVGTLLVAGAITASLLTGGAIFPIGLGLVATTAIFAISAAFYSALFANAIKNWASETEVPIAFDENHGFRSLWVKGVVPLWETVFLFPFDLMAVFYKDEDISLIEKILYTPIIIPLWLLTTIIAVTATFVAALVHDAIELARHYPTLALIGGLAIGGLPLATALLGGFAFIGLGLAAQVGIMAGIGAVIFAAAIGINALVGGSSNDLRGYRKGRSRDDGKGYSSDSSSDAPGGGPPKRPATAIAITRDGRERDETVWTTDPEVEARHLIEAPIRIEGRGKAAPIVPSRGGRVGYGRGRQLRDMITSEKRPGDTTSGEPDSKLLRY